ncbi:ornithine cyclodeaminase family protein [Curtobacterium sp. PhB136]|uniref:ornithine cyclodeaminase family protein n=1 Tax=Curtobacterium sp. PhB136 TaxID=2485181 RepID=UPI00104B1B1A|nr:ornithine cyclodeaminase family protein [Curtobacterium sp. PhB136]TCK63757.1 ornithine cyclodeaminase/alanine dehydrogenase [Curtobacterium sp. PhB136]
MTLVLGADDVRRLLPEVDAIAAVEAVHADLGSGAMVQPAPVTLGGTDDALFLPMAVRSDRLGFAAVKLMADIPANVGTALPSQRSTILVSSVSTGECIAVIDGAGITRVRTAAASAVATRHLARPDSRVLGLVGAGNLAIEHVRAISAVRPIEQVVVWSRSSSTVERFREQLAEAGDGATDVAVVVAEDPHDVVERTDVLCTLTPSVEPIVRGAWLHRGQHVNAVGARPRPTHRELDATAMARGTLVVDSAATARAKSGDLVLAIAEGALRTNARLVELGEVVAGLASGRASEDEITVFDSVGLAAQDLAVAAAVIQLAQRHGVGETVHLSAAASSLAPVP